MDGDGNWDHVFFLFWDITYADRDHGDWDRSGCRWLAEANRKRTQTQTRGAWVVGVGGSTATGTDTVDTWFDRAATIDGVEREYEYEGTRRGNTYKTKHRKRGKKKRKTCK